MIAVPSRRVLAALALVLGPAAMPAQTAAVAALAGSASTVRVLDVGRVTGVAQSNPSVRQELWAEGEFLGYRGKFYHTQLNGFGTTRAFVGSGSFALRVGPDTVRTGFSTAFQPRVDLTLRRDVWSADRSMQYSVAGVAVELVGNVEVALRTNCAFTWLAGGVQTDGFVRGDGNGSVTARIPSAYSIFAIASQSATLRFGQQELSGRCRMWSWGNERGLTYERQAIDLRIQLALRVFSSPWFSGFLLDAERPSTRLASFF